MSHCIWVGLRRLGPCKPKSVGTLAHWVACRGREGFWAGAKRCFRFVKSSPIIICIVHMDRCECVHIFMYVYIQYIYIHTHIIYIYIHIMYMK